MLESRVRHHAATMQPLVKSNASRRHRDFAPGRRRLGHGVADLRRTSTHFRVGYLERLAADAANECPGLRNDPCESRIWALALRHITHSAGIGNASAPGRQQVDENCAVFTEYLCSNIVAVSAVAREIDHRGSPRAE